MFSKRCRKQLVFITLFGLHLSFPIQTFAQNREFPIPKLETHENFWPEPFLNQTHSAYQEIKSRFVNALFEDPTDIDLGGTQLWKLNLTGNIHREIFNNYDILNSWTVVDRTRLNFDVGQWVAITSQISSLTPSINASWFSLGIGAKAYIDWWDIRQLLPEDFNKNRNSTENTRPPPLASLNQETQEDDIQNINPYLHGDITDFPGQVKLHRVFNLIQQPFKMPLHASVVKKHMIDGEIIRFNVVGDVSGGISLGPNLSMDSNLGASAKISPEIHFTDEFQFSVQRENARYAKVRVNFVKSVGTGLTVEAKMDVNQIYKGFLLFKGKSYETRLGEVGLSLIPFQVKLDHTRSNENDWGFRYDLNSAEGLIAYHKAVLGNLSYSEDIANEQQNLKNKSVEFLFKDQSKRLSGVRSKLFDLFSIYRKQNTFHKDSIDTEITLPNGSSHLFRQVSETTRETHNLTGHTRKSIGRISFYLDKDSFNAQKPNSISLLLEKTIEDNSAWGDELNAYCHEVERFFDIQNIFPVLPTQVPRLSDHEKMKNARYGRSVFYFGFNLNQDQIFNMIGNNIDSLINRIQEEDLDVPTQSLRDAKEALLSHNADDLEIALKEILSKRNRELDFIQLLDETIDKKNTEKFLVAQNNSFGNIQDHGHQLTQLERFYRDIDRDMHASDSFTRSTEDPDSSLSDINTSLLPDGRVQINFTTNTKPEFIYFKIHPDRRKKTQKNISEFIFWNRSGLFKEGKNSFILDLKSEDPFIKTLVKWVIPNETYLLTMGYSNHDKKWGFGSSARFKTGSNF